ncbi:MAG: InlB B-repeat-containing protein [Bacilli bacterium]|nr:InlB B-repeat-containing protein [Bacilli bacterium]
METKRLKRTLLGLAAIGLVLGCTSLVGLNPKKAEAETNPNVGYRTRAWVYSDAVKQKIESACFTLKDEMGNTIVSNTTTEMNPVVAYNYEKGTLLCDVVTLTKPSYASYTATRPAGVSVVMAYYVVEVLYNGERIYREDYSHSFTVRTWKEESTASNLNDKCIPYSTANYEFDNSYCNNADALPNAMTINSEKEALPSFVGNTFTVYENDSAIEKTYKLPSSSLADVEFAGYFEKDQKNQEYEMFYDSLCAPVKTGDLCKDTTLTALFKSNIVLNTNGGEFATPTTFSEEMIINDGCYLVGEEMKLPTPVRENYSFIGWTGTGYDAPTINATIPADAAGELSYTANWIANNCVVTFTTGEGGSEVPQQSVEFGGYITKPENPTRTLDGIRYEFVEWVYDDQGTKIPFDFTTPVFESLTLEATWVSYVDVFVTTCMHPEIDPSNPGTGSCITEGWYANAKIAFNLLTDEERAAFLSQTEYKPYADRLLAWAAANGDTIIGQILVGSASLPNEVINNDSLIIISIIVCSLACTFISVIIVIRRKQKINK